MLLLSSRMLLVFILIPAFLCQFTVVADEDPIEEDEIVDDEGVDVEEEDGEGAVVDTGEETTDEDGDPLKGSNDADTVVLFTKPSYAIGVTPDLPAGEPTEFLVGFTNKGAKDYTLQSLDVSFRYPMDFSFYIQNFTTISYDKTVKPGQQATLMYSFVPSDAFSSRQFGLTVNLGYKDGDGASFLDAVFNETVSVVEVDEGLDGETFFLYVFLAAFVVLLLVLGQQLLSSYGRKKGGAKRPVVEMGTKTADGVDYDWLPKEMIQELNRSPKTPKTSPKTSPRQRAKRSTGSDE